MKDLLQEKDNLIINAFNHIKAFQKKLLFLAQLKSNSTHHFLLLKEFKKSITITRN